MAKGSRAHHTRWELPAFMLVSCFVWVEHLLILLYIFTTVYIFIGYFYHGFLDYVHLFYITSSSACTTPLCVFM